MLKKLLFIFLLILSISVIYYFYSKYQNSKLTSGSTIAINQNIIKLPEDDVSIYFQNLNVPWEIAFLSENKMIVTERDGNLLLIENKQISQTFKISEVSQSGEGGLLGIAVHPNFKENNFIYLYYTISKDSKRENRVVRYTLKDNNLIFNKIILSDIRANIYHNAGKIEFGPDGYLYVTAGDALDEPAAQDTKQLAGKILRVTEEGGIPSDNPFNSYVYSLGHRNPQGLTWDDSGNLWSTEHGQSGVVSGLDELNKIQKGGNYGWPNFRGNQNADNFISPEIHSGNETWAPGDTEYYEGNIFFTGLRGEALYKYNLDTKELKKYFTNEYGRLRAITLGPDNYFYVTTSNRDGRGTPKDKDDKIIRINPQSLK